MSTHPKAGSIAHMVKRGHVRPSRQVTRLMLHGAASTLMVSACIRPESKAPHTAATAGPPPGHSAGPSAMQRPPRAKRLEIRDNQVFIGEKIPFAADSAVIPPS
jgi:hypothetical protein